MFRGNFKWVNYLHDFTPICFFGKLLPDNYHVSNRIFKVGNFYFYSRVFFVTQNFIRSCVIHSIFFPTHSYMFFQWKTFQMRLQDFRFFIPPVVLMKLLLVILDVHICTHLMSCLRHLKPTLKGYLVMIWIDYRYFLIWILVHT